MPSMSYKVEGLAELKNWLTKTSAVLAKIPTQVMDQVITEGVQYIQAKSPVDTGYMRANVSGRVTGAGNGIIESTAYYTGFVNFGTRFMDAQPFFSDGVDYVSGRIRRLMEDQIIAVLRSK